MKNRNVGFLIIGISLVIGLIIWIFNSGLRKIVTDTCSHGPTCSMYSTISMQTWLSVAIALVVLVIGLFLVFSKEETKIITKTKTIKPAEQKKQEIDYSKLDKEEKAIMKIIEDSEGIFQSELVEKSSFDKVKVTRILDRLEGKQLIERKRRGMTNFVALKN